MKACILLVGLAVAALGSSLAGAQEPMMLGLGDSIGEGVQSIDANYRTQPHSYLNLLASQMGIFFPLPLITSSPAGMVGDVSQRSRLFPRIGAANLSVSGATVNSLLTARADASFEGDIDSETDLVLFPRVGSQVEIAEELHPQGIVCWIGNNDVLSAVLAYDQLDASQMTPVQQFFADFNEIADRLSSAGEFVIFGNIPDVTRVGFLVDRQDLVRFLGSDFGLAEGSYTSIVAMLLIQQDVNNSSLLQDSDYVLDSWEIDRIQ
ncbi:MAG TPA: SGNH/GDSL hydrolase family protein, partial [Thermodesulfobacteriota bacterium]|nr:SGNH/GDSL hydrolase family protein [Thermodesulfobacteriota bacterium]